jgi:hypothetical protein
LVVTSRAVQDPAACLISASVAKRTSRLAMATPGSMA